MINIRYNCTKKLLGSMSQVGVGDNEITIFIVGGFVTFSLS